VLKLLILLPFEEQHESEMLMADQSGIGKPGGCLRCLVRLFLRNNAITCWGCNINKNTDYTSSLIMACIPGSFCILEGIILRILSRKQTIPAKQLEPGSL
jgi:hypothetical protein